MLCSPPQPTWDLTIHSLSGPSVLAGTCSLLQLMWNPPTHSLWGPSSLLAHRLVSTPLQGSASSLTHRSVSGSDTICNKPKSTASKYYPLWAFPFGLLLKVFKMRLLGRGFRTLIKNASFSSPTDSGISHG